MKKHLIYIIGIAAASFTACENIDEDERFIEVEGVTAQRVVLLEDYTGQACVNCPTAHDVATELHELYHDNLIVVSMHAGPMAMSAPMGLKQEEGDVYAAQAGIETYPSGVVNRRSGVLGYAAWMASVRDEMQRESQLNLTVEAEVKEGKLSIETNLTALADLTGKLQLWILEDSIVGPQIAPTGYNPQYVHNHVFRDAVNGTWGEEVTLELGEEKTIAHDEVVLDETWNPDNLSVVAFVYGADGVLQAAQNEVNVINE